MYIVSRALGEAVIVNEELVFTLAAIGELNATLTLTQPNGMEGVEIEIRTNRFQEIASGVAATYIPFRSGTARIGFIAIAGTRIRRGDSSASMPSAARWHR